MKYKLVFDRIWVNWSWIAAFPMLICSFYRYFTQKNYQLSKPECFFLDNIFRLLLSPGLFYYSLDLFFQFWYWESFNQCSAAYVFHHIVTLAGAYSTLTIDHYPYFMMFPFAFHNLVLMFPDSFLDYVYFVSFFWWFKSVLAKPWIEIGKYQWNIAVSLTLVSGPLMVLYTLGCSNAIPVN